MSLFTKGFATACLLSNKQLVVHQKALKALHILFDMEVSQLQTCADRATYPSVPQVPMCSRLRGGTIAAVTYHSSRVSSNTPAAAGEP